MSPELERLESRLAEQIQGLSASQTQSGPQHRVGAWNIQQIVEHLLLTYQLSAANFEGRIEKGTPTRARPTLSQRLGQVLLLRLNFFPPGRKAPGETLPSAPFHLRTGAELAAMLHAELARLDDLITRAELSFGTRQAVSHPVLGPLSASQWRKFHLVHGTHHTRQIRAIRGETRKKPA
jgi:hypothetical protein